MQIRFLAIFSILNGRQYYVHIYLLSVISAAFSLPCASRDYGNGGTVCVCNTTYCDTIPRPERVPPPNYILYTSNQAGLRFQRTNGTFKTPSQGNEIFIDWSQEFQNIIGFGGAFTDATGINIRALPENLQEMILRAYFSKDGIEYSLGRVPIAGTDFSTRAYTYDDGNEDPTLSNFNLTAEDFDYKIPYILRATELSNNSLRLFCSAWSAPPWMKTNDAYNGFGFIRSSMYGPWAQYYLRFLEEYQKQGVEFWGMTTGNEPANVINPFDQLEVVGWPSWLLTGWISNYLGPAVQNSSFSNIQIMMLDDQRIFLPWYVDRVLSSSTARSFVNGIAVHWYLDQYIPATVLDQTHYLYPDKFILNTEASIMPAGGEPAVLLGSWRRAEEYSMDIIEDLQNWVTGWTDWNMVLNLQGGPNYINNFVEGAIIVNATSNEFYKQPLYYHLGHFSKFLPRDSVRVPTAVRGRRNLYVVAFERPDRSKAVVLLNRNDQDTPVRITDGIRGTIALTLTPRSINTLLYW